ncbi:hypothetical protein QU38_00085, partial [Staphylococcus aureus]
EIERHRIVAPMAGGDHAAVEIEDAREFRALEADLAGTSDGERGYGSHLRAVALLPLLAALGQHGIQPLAHRLQLAAHELELLGLRIEQLAARRAIGHEILLPLLGFDQRGLGRDADHHRAFGHVAG